MTTPEFVCPRDHASLVQDAAGLSCPHCNTIYPVINGIPVLIDDEHSVFSRADYQRDDSYLGASYGSAADRVGLLQRWYRSAVVWLYETGVPLESLDARAAVQRMLAEKPDGRVLVVGCGEMTFEHPNIVYSDVAFGSHTHCICDAHSLPFADGYFAGVLAIAVLEHVVDPYRCAEEIRRVLAPDGMVYAVTPFLQPVHMGAHDFTRFTYLGHRRLFRWFDDLESGCVLGPAASVSYVSQHLLLCVSDARWYRRIAKLLGIVMGAAIRQFDRIIGHRRGAYDAAGGFFFFGRKRAQPITDRELLTLYRGGQA